MDNDTTKVQLKRCIKCGEEKPANPEYFWRDRGRPDGFYHSCKSCCNAPKPPAKPDDCKTCPRCKKKFPATLEYFYQDKAKKFGLQTFCKLCFDAKRSMRVRNYSHEPLRKSITPLYNTPEVENQVYAYTKEDWGRCLDYWHGCCAVCGHQGRDLFGIKIVVADHWIPVKHPDCPGTVKTNIVPLCHSMKKGGKGCNNLKGSKHPEEWLITQYGKRRAAEIMGRINTYFEWVKCSLTDK